MRSEDGDTVLQGDCLDKMKTIRQCETKGARRIMIIMKLTELKKSNWGTVIFRIWLQLRFDHCDSTVI